jgi:hypothetical protein
LWSGSSDGPGGPLKTPVSMSERKEAATKEPEAAKVDEIVEEDDEFEEFEDEVWKERKEEPEEKQYWADDWDNDDVDPNFAMQLRTELLATAPPPPK